MSGDECECIPWDLRVMRKSVWWWYAQAQELGSASVEQLLDDIASEDADIASLLALEEKTPMAAAPKKDLSPGEVREALREGTVAALRMYQEEVQSQYLGALSPYRSDADGLRLAWELRSVSRALGVLQGASTEAGK